LHNIGALEYLLILLNMHKSIRYSVYFLLITLSGCSTPHFLYWPNSQYVPLFKEANTLTGTAGFSSGIINNCFEVQTGYSFPKNIAISGALMAGGNNNSSSVYDNYSKAKYFEASAGYYKPFGEYFVFELFGGYGGGWESHGFTYSNFDAWEWRTFADGHAHMRYSKFFAQSDLGVKFDWIEGSFSCRLSKLNFTDIVYSGVNYNIDKLLFLEQNASPFCIEPAFTVAIGIKPVKFSLQCVFSSPLANPDLKNNNVFEKARMMLGVQFNIAAKKQKTAEN
jgi:hypothetical protein